MGMGVKSSVGTPSFELHLNMKSEIKTWGGFCCTRVSICGFRSSAAFRILWAVTLSPAEAAFSRPEGRPTWSEGKSKVWTLRLFGRTWALEGVVRMVMWCPFKAKIWARLMSGIVCPGEGKGRTYIFRASDPSISNWFSMPLLFIYTQINLCKASISHFQFKTDTKILCCQKNIYLYKFVNAIFIL